MDKEFKQIAMNGVFNESDEVLLSIFDVHFKDNLNNINLMLKNGGVVCFTGNRPNSLPWKFNEDCELCKEFKIRLKDILIKFIENGFVKFITGMAMGFDIIAAEVVLELKKEYSFLELECVVPCLNQTRGWKRDYILRYKNIINVADKVTFTSSYEYFNGVYMIRNKYMVDSSDLVVGCQLKESAGTKATLKYANKQKKSIIIIK